MKKSILFLLLTAFLGLTLNAQKDTMYVMKNGVIVGRYNVNTQIDSLIYYNPFPTSGSFTDSRDGNTYKWVKIGTQIWMAENLKYLPSVVGTATGSYSVPCYYVYGYNGTNVTEVKASSNYNIYGVLYNWPAAMAGSTSSSENPSGVQGVCPSGWHFPSDAEWAQLGTLLGGLSVAGGKLKEAGTSHWPSPNTSSSDETGFTALPGGYRNIYGDFANIGIHGQWGCATYCCHWYMISGYEILHRACGPDPQDAFSVRCVKN